MQPDVPISVMINAYEDKTFDYVRDETLYRCGYVVSNIMVGRGAGMDPFCVIMLIISPHYAGHEDTPCKLFY